MPGGLARNTGFEVLADLTFTAGRLITFVILGRTLGVAELGRYASLLALTQLLFPVSQAGLPHVAVRNTARGADPGAEWRKTMSAISLSGTAFSLVVVVITGIVLDVAAFASLFVAVSQLVGLSTQKAAGLQAATQKRSDVGLAINATNTLARLASVLTFAAFASTYSLETWSRFLIVGAAVSTAATVGIAQRSLGLRLGFARSPASDLRAGAGFIFVQAASTAQADIDKVVLGAYDLDADVGAYSAAVRMTDVASVPLAALVRASYAEFFRRGSNKISEALPFAKTLTAIATSYAVLAGVALWALAPALPLVMGDDFSASVSALRWLSIIPALKAAQYFPANVLTGSDRQWTRATLMTLSALINLLMNLYLAPRFGLDGAIAATLAAETIFVALMWGAVHRAVSQERTPNGVGNKHHS